MADKRVFSLVQAVLLALLVLMPLMLVIGSAEGTAAAPGLLFWLLLLLPIVIVGWLLTCCSPDDTAQGHRVAVERLDDRDRGIIDAALGVERLIEPEVDVRRIYRERGLLVAEGNLQVPSDRAFAAFEQRLQGSRAMPLLESLGGRAVRVLFLPRAIDERMRRRSGAMPNLLLFLATLATTIHAGAMHQRVNLLAEPGQWMVGVPYALALLGVLGVHEMGHYVVARVHGVAVTLPYFIPVPMGLGTFGAFIQMRSIIRSRRAVFDIGIAGPLAGLFVAIPALYIGLQDSQAITDGASRTGVETGSSLLLALVYQAVHGGPLGSTAVQLSPVAFAGCVGLFVTALNLLPVGQLDGGHIAYGLFGRRGAMAISVVSIVAMLGVGLFVWPGLLTWAVLVTLLAGFTHMPALDDVTPPNGVRFALGMLAFVILALIVVPLNDELRLLLDSPYQ
jgi:membrane-associated protease RseP (regulator of RpoE activity)